MIQLEKENRNLLGLYIPEAEISRRMRGDRGIEGSGHSYKTRRPNSCSDSSIFGFKESFVFPFLDSLPCSLIVSQFLFT